MKIKTESAMFYLRQAQQDEIEHTNPDFIIEVPLIATSQAGEQVYMLVRKDDLQAIVDTFQI